MRPAASLRDRARPRSARAMSRRVRSPLPVVLGLLMTDPAAAVVPPAAAPRRPAPHGRPRSPRRDSAHRPR
ncbi:hypothetical protein ACFFX0_06685 [Citricoccus parietis]|uniref:Uncharacterized protein n=1 Tax=Citricoccus parietis TaxID=592307 RepID=A0ABV5FW35_9MICC